MLTESEIRRRRDAAVYVANQEDFDDDLRIIFGAMAEGLSWALGESFAADNAELEKLLVDVEDLQAEEKTLIDQGELPAGGFNG